MQHLLLVREEGDTKSRYFRLIDSLVTSVVLDKKPSFNDGLSNTVGLSVERLVAQFGESERAQALEKEASEARVQIGHLKLEKDALEGELAAVGDGLVGQLKDRLAATEEKLRISRLTTDAVQEQLKDERRMHEEQIQQLELQISELFKMLKESRGFASAMEASKGMDRKDLIYNISKQMERKKTIGILEGRRRQDMDSDDEGSAGAIEAEVGVDMDSLRRRRRTAERRRRQQPNIVDGDNMGRTSQFMDAEEERVRLHIEETLAAGAELMVSVYYVAPLCAGWLIDSHHCTVSTPVCISSTEGSWTKWFTAKNWSAFGCRRRWGGIVPIRFCSVGSRVHKGLRRSRR
jgi:cytokinesis protein